MCRAERGGGWRRYDEAREAVGGVSVREGSTKGEVWKRGRGGD